MPVAPPDRNRPRKKKRRTPYSPPATFRPEATSRTGSPRKGPPSPVPRSRRSGPSFAEPFRKPHGLDREQTRARDRARRAERRLPDNPGVPHVPVKADGYSRREATAIRRTYKEAAKRQGTTVQGLYRQASPAQRRQIRQVSRIVMFGPQVAKDLRPVYAQNRRDRVAPAGRTGRSRALATVLAQTSLGGASPENQFVKNIGGDIKAIGTAPFIGAYEVGAAGWEGLHGDTGRAKQLASGAWEGIKQSVPGKLVSGDPEGALEAFREHPLLAALDLSAAGAVAGRGAGAFARGFGKRGAPGIRGKLAEAGSTERAPLVLTDDAQNPVIVERRHSKDWIRKGGEQAGDSVRDRITLADGRVGHKAHEAERWSHLRREADHAASRANAMERQVRDEAAKEMRVRGIKGRRAQDLTALVVEGTITSAKHFATDLRAHRDRVKALVDEAHQELARTGKTTVYRDSRDLRAAEDRLETVEKALADPKVQAQAGKIVQAGEQIGRRLNEMEGEALKYGVLSNAQRARRSRLIPAAVEHLGGRHYMRDELRDLEKRGVPVRNPKDVEARQKAKGKRDSARERVRNLETSVRRLKERRARTVGAQGVRRGQEAQNGPLRAYYVGDRRFAGREGADAYAKKNGGNVRVVSLTRSEASRTGELERLDNLIVAKEKQLRKAYKNARQAQKDFEGTPKPKLRESVRGPDGRFLPNEEIERFLKDRGRDPETVAYLPHRLDTRGARAFHTQFRVGSRPVLDDPKTRTGSAYRKGATEASHQLVTEQAARLATQVEKARQIDRTVQDHGVKRDNGEHFTAAEALETVKRLEADTGRSYVAVRAFNAKLSKDTREVIAALQGHGPDTDAARLAKGGLVSIGQRLLNDRIVTEADKKGAQNVVLMPKEIIDRLNDHLKPAGEIQRFLQLINRPFRYAVLPLSPKWLVGNFVEPYLIRLTGVGSGINVIGLGMDIARSRTNLKKALNSDDPKLRQAARELDAQYRGGMFIGGGQARAVRRTGEDVKGLAWLTMVRDLPVIKQGVDLLRLLPDASFRLNKALERAAQDAALGRQLRQDVQSLTGSWMQTVKLQGKVYDEVMKGAVNTSTQRRWMRSMQELLGKYDGYSPLVRQLVQGAMPFLPWALNAARFVYWTMPLHRTIQTALLIKVSQTVEQDWQDSHANLPPGGLRLAVPTRDGGWLDLARYTPYGLTGPIAESVEENPKQALDPLFDQFLPQFSGAVAALRGKDPFGRDMKLDPRENAGESDPTFVQQLAAAAYAQGESTIPYLGIARRLREGGGTPYAGSTLLDPDTKPGTKRVSGVRRVFDPTVPTYLGPKPSTTSGKARSKTRTEELLERRAELLERSRGGRSSRADELLERRARLLRGR